MAGIGAITLDNAGAVTAPSTGLGISLPSAESTTVNKHALASSVLWPDGKGVMWANGIDPLRHIYNNTVLGTGLLAPSTALTATPSGAVAKTRLDTDNGGAYVIADGDLIRLIDSGLGGPGYVYQFKTAFGLGLYNEVLIGGSTAVALANLKKAINQTGVEGIDYTTVRDNSSAIVATTIAGDTDLTIEVTTVGTAGNSYTCTWTGGAGPRFEQESANTAQTLFSGGSTPTGSNPEGGVYQYAYAYVREDDGAVSGLSPTVEANTGSGGQVAISGMTASADTSVDYNRYYRTTAGGGRFYRVDEVAAATTTATDTYADSTTTAFGAVAYDERLYRSYRAGLPPKGRYLASYRGRIFTGGALLSANYTSGTVSINADATLATVTNGYPRESWIGRQVQFTTSETYTIMAVSESAGTFTIDRGLEGGSNLSGVTYTVRDTRDPYELFWSEPGLPNNWPVTNTLKGVTSRDGKGITGLYAAFESLIVFTRQAVWRLTGTGPTFSVSLVSDKCGCVSGHTVVMDGERMYWLGLDGVYGWAGQGEPVNLSTPSEQPGPDVRGIDDTIDRLSLGYAHRAFGIYDEHEGEVRFYLPLDGEQTNRYVLVLDLQTRSFALDTCEDVTCAAIVQGQDGEDHSITGDISGLLYEVGVSNSDGAYAFEPTQAVSSSTTRTVTVSGTPFPTTGSGLAGVPVWHFASDGTPVRRCVASCTSSVLTYRRYATAPSASTQFSVGGILMWVQTGRFDLGLKRLRKIIPGYVVPHSPDVDGQYWFFYAYDQQDFAIPSRGWAVGDLTATSGRRRFIAAKDAVLHGWGLMAVEPGCDPAFAAVTIEARSRDELD